ncbi:MAG: MaoC family dehydratase N-terminal domain-containing protein [Bacillota bacterium]
MDDLKQREGQELPAYSFVVERGKIKEFVQAVGDPNPVYVDREYAAREGYADVIAPPTFGICIDLWGGADFLKLCETFGLNPFKVLHGEQEYEYYGEIHPGDEITARPRLARVLSKEGKSGGIRMITLETTYFNQRGEKVLLARCLIVERR